MGFVLGKRGKRASSVHESLFYIFQLGLVIMIMIGLILHINRMADNVEFEQRFVSIDMSLVATALFMAPGTVKHMYYPLDFYIESEKKFEPMEAIIKNSEVWISPVGENTQKAYWFLSDLTIRPLVETVRIEGYKKEVGVVEDSSGYVNVGDVLKGTTTAIKKKNLTFYKSGFKIALDERKTNAYQLTCPVLNTSDKKWIAKKTFVARVNSKEGDPASRIVGILDSQFSEFSATNLGGSGSGIPKTAPAIIAIGDSGIKRDAGALIVYVPIDKNLLKHRKLACLVINHLLTEDSAVLYAQIMPVDVESLPLKSPLRVFKERTSESQVMVFLDLSSFSEKQVDVRNSAEAIKNAFHDFFGTANKYVRGYTICTSDSMRATLDKSPDTQTASATGAQTGSTSVATSTQSKTGEIIAKTIG